MSVKPVNSPVSPFEWLARTIYQPSQMKGSKLLKDCMWPRFKKQSKDFPGSHEFRISMQRLCYGHRSDCLNIAMSFQQPTQTLMGFKIGRGLIPIENGFRIEADGHQNNPFHAHIVVEKLKVPFDPSCIGVVEVMSSGVRRQLDNMTEDFIFVSIEDFVNNRLPVQSECASCL